MKEIEKHNKMIMWVSILTGAVVLGLVMGVWVVRPVVAKKVCQNKVKGISVQKNKVGKKYDITEELYQQCINSVKNKNEEIKTD